MKTTLILLASLFGLMLFAIVKKVSSAGKTEFRMIDDKVYYFTPDGSVPLYRNKTLLKNADPNTFDVFRFPYAKDQNQVYFNSHLLPGCDPASFAFISYEERFVRDKTQVFFLHYKLSDDPSHFEIIDHDFSKDRKNVYCFKKVVEGADPKSFERLGQYYYKDANFVFANVALNHPYDGIKKVIGADSKTFKVSAKNDRKGSDKENIFINGALHQKVK